jgi:hypothetical protein
MIPCSNTLVPIRTNTSAASPQTPCYLLADHERRDLAAAQTEVSKPEKEQ